MSMRQQTNSVEQYEGGDDPFKTPAKKTNPN
jgi:hypothetical protein